MHRINTENYTVTNEGKNQFTDGPPATTVGQAWLNSVQEEICNVIENSGLSLNTSFSDSKNQLWQALLLINRPYDIIVTSQSIFRSVIERVAANQYKIKDDYKSIYFKNLTGGYAMSGGESPLSGGDTWGYIETNNCTYLHFEPGAYIGFGDTQGYIEVNTDRCVLENMGVKGVGVSSASITQSFLLNASYVRYKNCWTSNRLSSSNMYGFQGSGTVLHNLTASYEGCNIISFDGTAIVGGFKDCNNLTDCLVYSVSADLQVYAYNACDNVKGCIAQALDANGANSVYGFYLCNELVACRAEDLDTGNGHIYGFTNCERLSSCISFDLQASGSGIVYGFYACLQICSSKAVQLDSASSGTVYGFSSCNQISGCYAMDIDQTGSGTAYGFSSCNQISGCYVDDVDSNTNNAYGIYNSRAISSCRVDNITSASGLAYGIHSCTYGAALYTAEASNASNDWIDTVDATIANKVSTGSWWT